MPDEKKVREANQRFYAAMNATDLDGMDEVWADVPTAVCVHPGREAIISYEKIRESWSAIFAAADSLSIAVGNEQITIADGVAWITCVETISMMMEGGLAAAAAQCTNIFRLVDGRWKMIVHHASPIPFMSQEE